MDNGQKVLFPELVKPGCPPKLIGSRCPDCKQHYFPPRKVCPQCFREGLDECILGGLGSVKIFTIVHAKPPRGFPSPYAVGYVKLIEEGLVIPSIITASDLNNIKVGMPVKLVVDRLSDDVEDVSILVYQFKARE